MSATDDFICDKFLPQRLRRAVCRNCYQPQRMHKAASNKDALPDRKYTTLPRKLSPDPEAGGESGNKKSVPVRPPSSGLRVVPKRSGAGYVKSASELQKRKSMDLDISGPDSVLPAKTAPTRPPPPRVTPPPRPPLPSLSPVEVEAPETVLSASPTRPVEMPLHESIENQPKSSSSSRRRKSSSSSRRPPPPPPSQPSEATRTSTSEDDKDPQLTQHPTSEARSPRDASPLDGSGQESKPEGRRTPIRRAPPPPVAKTTGIPSSESADVQTADKEKLATTASTSLPEPSNNPPDAPTNPPDASTNPPDVPIDQPDLPTNLLDDVSASEKQLELSSNTLAAQSGETISCLETTSVVEGTPTPGEMTDEVFVAPLPQPLPDEAKPENDAPKNQSTEANQAILESLLASSAAEFVSSIYSTVESLAQQQPGKLPASAEEMSSNNEPVANSHQEEFDLPQQDSQQEPSVELEKVALNASEPLESTKGIEVDTPPLVEAVAVATLETPPQPPPSNVPPPPPPPPILPPVPSFQAANVKVASSDEKEKMKVEDIRPLRPGSPRPPPLEDRTVLLAEIRLGRSLRSVPPPSPTPPQAVFAHNFTMASIKKGVDLRPVPAQPRPPPKDDINSELKKVHLRKMKSETSKVAEKVAEHRADFQELCSRIRFLQNRRNPKLRDLRRVLSEVDDLLNRSQISLDIAEKKFNYPTHIIEPMRYMVDKLNVFERKVADMNSLTSSYTREKVDRGSMSVRKDVIETHAGSILNVAGYLYRCREAQDLHNTDIELIMASANDAITPLINMLYEKAFTAYQNTSTPTAQKYGDPFKAKFARDLLSTCCTLTKNLATTAHLPTHPRYMEALDIQESCSRTSESEDNGLPAVEGADSPFKAIKASQTQIVEAINAGNCDKMVHLLSEIEPDQFQPLECRLISVAMATGNCKVVDALLECRTKMADSVSLPNPQKHDFDWLCEAVTKSQEDLLKHLVTAWNMNVNCVGVDTGNTPLHVAARKPSPEMMAALIRLKADTTALNSSRRTALQLLAIKCFPPVPKMKPLAAKEPLFDLAVYINNPSLSDVVLISEDGMRFHAHRIVLCSQSAVFKAMMASSHWGTTQRQEVKLQMVDAKAVRGLLQYLYTGKCTYAGEDLNLGVELVMVADQFLLEPMRRQCEAILSERIDEEVAVPLFNVASLHSTPSLLNAVCHFILMNYEKLSDEGNQTILNLLANCEHSKPSRPGKTVNYQV